MEITEQRVSSFRAYFMEYTILFLVAAVITLFGLYYNLNDFVTKQIMSDKAKDAVIIEKNTQVLQLLIYKNSKQ